MLNLKEKESLNFLNLEARRRIWIPEIIFHNTENKIESLIDHKAFATVLRNGTFIRRNLTHLHNAYLYDGAENPITLSRVYSERFLCDFDMSVYPFDTQSCRVTYVVKGNADNLVSLLAKDLQYLGPKDLTIYFVKDLQIFDQTLLPAGIQSVNVELTFGRKILSTILTTYLPTFLICLVSFATNYFKGFFFEAIVTVNLTSLLVLTTLFISVSNSLPTTAYVKLMDVWLIVCLVMPFSEVMLQVKITTCSKKSFMPAATAVASNAKFLLEISKRKKERNVYVAFRRTYFFDKILLLSDLYRILLDRNGDQPPRLPAQGGRRRGRAREIALPRGPHRGR